MASRQAVKPSSHIFFIFFDFFFDPAVIFSLAAGRSLYLIYKRLDVCALPYSVFSLPKTAVKRWKIAKNQKKVKKIPKKRIFSTFFVGFTCKYTSLVYFISVDRKNGTQPKGKRQ